MYRIYLYWLLLPVALLGGAIVGLTLWLEPLAGDLTRIGGYSENEYGWRGAQERFTPPLAEPADLNHLYDILVFGDSFSLSIASDQQTKPGGFWVDYLARETGLTVGVVHYDKLGLAAYLASAAYRDHPPRALIYETVERGLRRREIAQPVCTSPAAAASAIALVPRVIKPVHFQRMTGLQFSDHALAATVDFLTKVISRLALAETHPQVLRFPLARADLFTSRRARDLLVYHDDLDKVGWSGVDWTAIGCQLLALQAMTEANRRTRFLTVIAPDKLSAYAAILGSPVGWIDGTERLSKVKGLDLPRADLALKAAIAAGVADVYLPNDTHFGSVGARIFALTVARTLEGSSRPSATAD
jgi:hypothetical protein